MKTGACQDETLAWPAFGDADRAAWDRFRGPRASLRGPVFTPPSRALDRLDRLIALHDVPPAA